MKSDPLLQETDDPHTEMPAGRAGAVPILGDQVADMSLDPSMSTVAGDARGCVLEYRSVASS